MYGRRPGGARERACYNARGMATNALEVRMARLEGSYEQLDKRLGDLAADLQALRAEFRTEIQAVRAELQNLRAEFRSELQNLRAEFRSDIHGLRGEIQGVRAEVQGVRAEIQGLRAEMGRLFYWLLGTFLAVVAAFAGTIVTVLVRVR